MIPIAKVFDTRDGTGGATEQPMTAGQEETFTIDGVGGVASTNVSAVMLVINAINPSGEGVIRVFPDDQSNGSFSDLLYNTGDNATNTAIVPVDSDGALTVYNGTGSADVSISVQGYFTTSGGSSDGNFTATSGVRLVDSRNGTGVSEGPVAAGTTISIPVAGTNNIPSGASAVVLNLGALSPTGHGTFNAWAAGATEPILASGSFDATGQSSTATTVQIGTNGSIDVAVNGSATQVTVDVEGYFTATSGSPNFVPTNQRVYDSRGHTELAAGATTEVDVVPFGTSGNPTEALHVGVLNNSTSGGLRVWDPDNSAPTFNQLDFDADQDASTLLFSTENSSGQIKIENMGSSSINLTIDVQGYFAGFGPPVPVQIPTVAISGTSAFLDWLSPDTSVVTNYTATISPAVPAGSSQTVTGTQATFTGLSASTTYSFTIVANNSGGSSPPETAQSVAATPPSPPGDVVLSSGSAGTLIALWDQPDSVYDDQPNSLTGYTATLLNSAGSTVATLSTDADTSTVTFPSSTVGNSYSASVTAANQFGNSTAGASGAQVSGAPNPVGPVSVDVGAGALTASWQAASIAPSSYTITATPSAGGSPVVTTAAGSATSATVSNLTNGVTYNVAVAATNSVGNSTSTNTDGTAPAAPPTATAGITATGLGGAVEASWTSQGTGVSFYQINALDSSGNILGTTYASNTDTSAVVNGLGSVASVRVQVISESNSGATAASSPSTATSSNGTQDTDADDYNPTSITSDFESTHAEVSVPSGEQAAFQSDMAAAQDPDSTGGVAVQEKAAALAPYAPYDSDDTSTDTSFDDPDDPNGDFGGCATGGRPQCSNSYYIDNDADLVSDSQLNYDGKYERKAHELTAYVGLGGFDCITGADLNVYMNCTPYESIFKGVNKFITDWVATRPLNGNTYRLVVVPFVGNGGAKLSPTAQRTNAFNYVNALNGVVVPHVNDINNTSEHCSTGCPKVKVIVRAGIDAETGRVAFPKYNTGHYTVSWSQEFDNLLGTDGGILQWNNVGFSPPSCDTLHCYNTAVNQGWNYSQLYSMVYGLASAYAFPQIYAINQSAGYEDLKRYANEEHLLEPQYRGVEWQCWPSLQTDPSAYQPNPGDSWNEFKTDLGQSVPYLSRQYTQDKPTSCDP